MLTWGVLRAPGGRRGRRRPSAAPPGPWVGGFRPRPNGRRSRPAFARSPAGPERAEPPRPPAPAPTPRGPGPPRPRVVRGALAGGCRTPTSLGPGRIQAEPAGDGVSSWGEWSWGETSPDPLVAAHVNARNGGSAVLATHRGAPQCPRRGVRAAPPLPQPSLRPLRPDRKSPGAPLCVPPQASAEQPWKLPVVQTLRFSLLLVQKLGKSRCT